MFRVVLRALCWPLVRTQERGQSGSPEHALRGKKHDFRPAKVMVSAGRNLRSEVQWENQKR